MTTPLGISFSTDDNTVEQADIRLLGKMMESFIVEFDQGKFEEFLSSRSTSPNTMRQYRKVSSENRSQNSSEISPKVACTSTHSASGATSNEVLKTSRATHAFHVNTSRRPARIIRRYTIITMVKINPPSLFSPNSVNPGY